MSPWLCLPAAVSGGRGSGGKGGGGSSGGGQAAGGSVQAAAVAAAVVAARTRDWLTLPLLLLLPGSRMGWRQLQWQQHCCTTGSSLSSTELQVKMAAHWPASARHSVTISHECVQQSMLIDARPSVYTHF